jgi:predicted TIM-barrel fold metal-dependent hydrolase
MYKQNGHEVFIVDGHVHFWNGSPENQRNEMGKGWIDCFFGLHNALSPEAEKWPHDKFCQYSEATMMKDLFEDGYVDVAIFNSTYLYEFFKEGFNTHQQNHVLKQKYPERFILCGSFDPRDGEAGLDALRAMVEEYPIQGLKLYTAEWKGSSKGWSLKDPMAYKYLEATEKAGIKNVHVHKGPTVYPLSRDAFDVHDVDYAATDFPNLNFIVEHCGLPRLEDFCWIATQERNVYAGLAVAMPFIHPRPRYFAEIIANLLFWIGPDKILFGSDYAIWTPKWLIDKFVAFELPDDIKAEFGVDLTPENKAKILGGNAAALYGIDIESHKAKLAQDEISTKFPVAELQAH